MTSKKSFCSLIFEDMKQRLWSIVLALIVIILPSTIACGMQLGARRYDIVEGNVSNLMSFSNENVWLYVIAIVGALICAGCGFAYLFSEKKVDFFHSLPIKRSTMFAVRYVSGVLVYAVPNIIMLLINSLVITGYGAMSGSVILDMLFGFVYHLFGFLIVYSVAIVAMMLVGNLLVFLLVSGWFFLCIPAYLGIYSSMESSFFGTFLRNNGEAFGDRLDTLRFFSPGSFYCAYMPRIVNEGKTGSIVGMMLSALLFAIVVTVIALVLYLKRPSESSKKAIAFQLFKPILRVSVELWTGVGTAYLFYIMVYDNRRDTGWMLFGAILGVVLSHMLIETIFNYDIRKCFHGLPTMIVCAVLAATFSMTMRFDAFGYDRYVPNKEKLQSVGIQVNGLDGQWAYRFEQRDGATGELTYNDFFTTRLRMLDDMELTNNDVLYAFIEKCVSMNAEDAFDEVMASYTTKSGAYDAEPQGLFFDAICFRYTMKNGHTETRRYVLPHRFLEAEFGPIFESEEFKAAQYATEYTIPAQCVQSVFVQREGEEVKLSLDSTAKAKLLECLRKDIAAQTWAERCGQTACLSLELRWITGSEGQIGNGEDGWIGNSYEYYDFSRTKQVAIFETFTNTLQFMQEHGIMTSSDVSVSRIAGMSINITQYDFTVMENGQMNDYSVFAEWDDENNTQSMMYTVNGGAPIRVENKGKKERYGTSNFIVSEEDWQALYDICVYRAFSQYDIGGLGGQIMDVLIEMKPDEYGDGDTMYYYISAGQDLRFLFD